MKKMPPAELESFVHRELRALPARPAPRTLEARVLAALEQRAAIPWYHQSWSYWPAVWRALFLVVASGVAGVMLAGTTELGSGFSLAELGDTVAAHLPGLARFYVLAEWLVELASRSVASIPSLWLWGALAVFMTLNATFFGLGVVAYRTLFRKN